METGLKNTHYDRKQPLPSVLCTSKLETQGSKKMRETEFSQHGYYPTFTINFSSPWSQGGEGLHYFHGSKSCFNYMMKTTIGLIRILSRLGRFYDFEHWLCTLKILSISLINLLIGTWNSPVHLGITLSFAPQCTHPQSFCL